MNSILYCLHNLSGKSRLGEMDAFIQHGGTSCLKHTIAVAYYSILFADFMRIRCNRRELIRGAVLHDYFLYDWHDGKKRRGVHGFTHPRTAMVNADRDFRLTETERDIIIKHMFPLTFFPPVCREGWIVCLIDKLCSVYETFKRKNSYSRVIVYGKTNGRELYREIQTLFYERSR